MQIVSKRDGFVVVGRAHIVGANSDLVQAWAERSVWKDEDLKFLLGNYVEAEKPNLNGHTFPLEDLAPNVHTVKGKALDMGHAKQYCVGYCVDGQLLTADGAVIEANEVEAAAGTEPFMQNLSAFWHNRFPDEWFDIKQADSKGVLAYSMEAMPGEVSCPTCDLRVPFDGLESATYCDEMQGPTGPKRIHNPRFLGCAVVLPPHKPAWSRADTHTLAAQMQKDYLERLEAGFDEEFEGALTVAQWEAVMAEIMA